MTSYNTWGISWANSWATSWTRSASVPVADTHDGGIPDHIVRKFYENERLKQKTVIIAYKKAIEAEPENVELQEVVADFTADTTHITKSQMKEIAKDKAALIKLLSTLEGIEARLSKYAQDAEDDEMLIMIAAIIH